MSEILVTRRELVKMFVTLGVAGAVGYWRLFSDDNTELRAEVVESGGGSPTFETFAALSALVTLRDNLDQATARRMYAVFMEEPWAGPHISGTYGKIGRLAREGRELGSAKESLSDGERWFVSHLLTTWYLGVYYHQERPTRRVAYETALMFDSLRGVVPIPFLQATGFGGWSRPPKEGHER